MIRISVPFHGSVPTNRTLSSTGLLSVQLKRSFKAGSQYDAGNSVALRRASTSYCEHDFAPTSVDARCDVTLRSS